VFVFFVIALVIGIGALKQYFFAPRTPLATVNGQSVERQWYQKNLAYNQFVLQHQIQDVQSQYQALAANLQANAAATATANPQPSTTPAAAQATATLAPSPSSQGTAQTSETPAGSPTATFTPSPTFNPQETATVGSLVSQFNTDQTAMQSVNEQSLDDLIDVDLMRQNAGKFGITVGSDHVAAQAKKTTDQIGGEATLKQLFQTAHLSQGDFDQIQYNAVLKDKFQAYFAAHTDQAPPPSPTPTEPPTATPLPGPQPPSPAATPTPVPTPGAESLESWLEGQRQSASITRSPLPSAAASPSA